MESNHKSIPPIGEDLLLEIFKRLPAESLGRFQWICKSWKSLISSTFFVKLHNSFNNSSATPLHLKPYLLFKNNRLSCHDSFTLCRPQTQIEHLKQDHVRFPFRYPHDFEGLGLEFVDVIRGVVCLSYSTDSTILWNPAIHKYVVLPSQSGQKTPDHSCSIGFGYDSSINDFKVVRIWIPNDDTNVWTFRYRPLVPIYDVYSLQEGTWRVKKADNLKYLELLDECRASTSGCFVNGNIHWLVFISNEFSPVHLVLMFDCAHEEFATMKIPREIFLGQSFGPRSVNLLEYGGMLSIVASSFVYYDKIHVQLWVMEEYGAATTWKKLYSFRECPWSKRIKTDMYERSSVDLAPYGPKQWTAEFSSSDECYNQILNVHVYEESMLLMDHPEVESYRNSDIVRIRSKQIQGV